MSKAPLQTQKRLRAFVRRTGAPLVFHAIRLVKRSPALKRLALRVGRRFPAAWEFAMFRYQHALSGGRDRAVPRIAAMPERPYAWNSSASQASHFKEMLVRELQQRRSGRSENR
jgi:hypothetical protein